VARYKAAVAEVRRQVAASQRREKLWQSRAASWEACAELWNVAVSLTDGRQASPTESGSEGENGSAQAASPLRGSALGGPGAADEPAVGSPEEGAADNELSYELAAVATVEEDSARGGGKERGYRARCSLQCDMGRVALDCPWRRRRCEAEGDGRDLLACFQEGGIAKAIKRRREMRREAAEHRAMEMADKESRRRKEAEAPRAIANGDLGGRRDPARPALDDARSRGGREPGHQLEDARQGLEQHHWRSTRTA
jgi:hypothetical protein